MKTSFNHSIAEQAGRAGSRREFLGGLGGLAGLAVGVGSGCRTVEGGADPLATAPGTVQPVVGTQLYGWGQYYGKAGRDLDRHIDEVLDRVAECGYAYAETSLDVAVPENTARFAERLRRRGLRPVSLYTGGAFHVLGKASETGERIVRAARVASKAGFRVIVCNPDPIGRDKTDAELVIQAEALEELGTELSRIGMQLGLHHHTPEMRQGGREFHSNFARTRPGVVGFCYDVHWVWRGGLAPEPVLEQYGGRVVSWHLRQSRNQVWWEDLAAGDIDFGAVARFSAAHGLAPRYTVELAIEDGTQITRDVVENHRRSRNYVRYVFGV